MTKKKMTHSRQDAKDETFNTQNTNNKRNNQRERENQITVSKPNMEQDSNEKLQNLKFLNTLLIKETMERRQQVESLEQAKEALETELARFHQERKGLETELTLEECKNLSLELEKSVIAVFMETQFRDMCNDNGDLSRMYVELGKVKDEKALECSELRKRLDELVGVVERERVLSNDVRKEKDLLKTECESWVAKARELKETLNDTDNVRRNLEARFEKLKHEYEKLVGEKEDGERTLQTVAKERDGVRDSLVRALEEIDELKRKVEELAREKRGIESEKKAKEVKVNKLEEEVGLLNEIVTNSRKQEEKLRDKVVEMEKRHEDAIKNAFQVKESSVEDLKRQVEYLQDSVIKEKKKTGFWTLLSSAATVFAAVSIAYLSRGR